MSQAKEILDYIHAHGSITTLQAFGLGITRLASRVHDIRRSGVDIEREMITVKNRHGDDCRVARYTIAGEREPA